MDIETIRNQILKNDLCTKIAFLMLGVFLLALNYNLFLLPDELVIGGTSGLAIVVHDLLGWSPTVFIYITSAILIVFSYFLLGKKIAYRSIIGSFLYPLMLTFTEPLAKLLRVYVEFDNMLITVIITSILYGVANGIIYKMGFNTGGSDILMKIINKYAHITEGKAVFILNGIIILLGGFTFGVNKLVYALLILVIYSRIVDNILIGVSNSKLFFIYTKEYKKVKEYLLEELKTGVTILETEGGFSKKKGYMLMCAIPTKDYYMFKEIVLSIDPNAFFVIHDCYEVYGGKRHYEG